MKAPPQTPAEVEEERRYRGCLACYTPAGYCPYRRSAGARLGRTAEGCPAFRERLNKNPDEYRERLWKFHGQYMSLY